MGKIIIHADGACKGNGKSNSSGGWAVTLVCGDRRKVLTGSEEGTTNNRMELMSAIAGLEALTKDNCDVELIMDSKYVIDGIVSWVKKWKKKAWRTAAGAPVKNRELWERLDAVNARHRVTWKWVKGHAVNDGNNEVDELAQEAAMRR